MRKPGILFLLGIVLLNLCGVQGTPVIRSQRCSCIDTSQQMIHLNSLKGLKQFAPSPAYKKIEIIALMKNENQAMSKSRFSRCKETDQTVGEKDQPKEKTKQRKKNQKTKKAQKNKKPQSPRQKKTA